MPSIKEAEIKNRWFESLEPWQKQLFQGIDSVLRNAIQGQVGDVPHDIEPGGGGEPLGLVIYWVQPDQCHRSLSLQLARDSTEGQPVLQAWVSLWKDMAKEAARWWWSSDAVKINPKVEDLAERLSVLVDEVVGEKHVGDLKKIPLSH